MLPLLEKFADKVIQGKITLQDCVCIIASFSIENKYGKNNMILITV